MVAGCMLMLSACTTDNTLPAGPADNEGKTPIELTVGIAGESGGTTRSGDATTRAVTSGGLYGKTAQAFSAGTNIYMAVKCDNGGTTTYTRTMGTTDAPESDKNTVNFSGTQIRYWEDAHSPNSRDSKLSVYAACVPDKTEAIGLGTYDTDYVNEWKDTPAPTTTITWPLNGTPVQDQGTGFVDAQDLCFSNNVSDLTGNDPADNRIKFDNGTNKFTTGNMIFYRALTKVTFVIKKSQGFGTGDNDFKFTEAGKNIILKNFYTSGTFDIVSGEFKTADPDRGTADINAMYVRTDNHTAAVGSIAYTLDCLMLPGTNLNDATPNQINFTIDHNEYHLTKKQLMDALYYDHDNNSETANVIKTLTDNTTNALNASNEMLPGVNYVFTVTVGKKKVDKLTAAVMPWEEVASEETEAKNARIVLTFLDPTGGDVTGDNPDIDLFRSTDYDSSEGINDNYTSFEWKTGYATTDNPSIYKAELDETGTSGLYTAKDATDTSKDWYWPNNKTFYHFRMVRPKTTTTTPEWRVNVNSTYGDYITLTGHEYSDTPASSYKDVCWGAPFKSTLSKVTYSKDTGFDNKGAGNTENDHQITKAIGPTESTINIVMFHMMSDVTIKLITNVGAEDAVSLDNATLTFSNIYNNGLVRMGNGKVEKTGEVASPAINGTVENTNHTWRYGFVPQDLSSVKLTIQTTDKNLYIVNMGEVVAKTIGSNIVAAPTYTDNKIDYWYPNYKYTYTFKLTKKDISLITATLANYEPVTAEEEGVQIQ